MLLQFSVENFRSFHKESILNLIPAKSRIHRDHVIRLEEKGRKVKALPLAVFYGANASGKSNFVRAMDFAKNLIVDGTRAEESIKVVPFQLAPDAIDKPSRFEFILKYKDVLYTYGFKATKNMIQEEWLFSIFKQREVRLFERITENGKARLEFGDKLAHTQDERQRLHFVAEGTRPNQLFLTEAFERNVEALKPLMEWFRECLVIIWPEAQYTHLISRVYKDESFKSFLSKFLQLADTGIESIFLNEKDIDVNRIFSDVPEEVRKTMLDDLAKAPEHSIAFRNKKQFFMIKQSENSTTKLYSIKTNHRSSNGELITFDTKDESDGTLRMMHLAPALIGLQSLERIFVIDEVDRSMHPLLCRLYVEAFLHLIKNQESLGQMILTTHNTCLLDLDLLRRDEIWFVEKDKDSSSRLSSLAEFKYQVRADLKVAKGYLNGRFGAIPFTGDVRQLFRKGAAE